MKALTFVQPHATAVLLGIKTVENRPRPTSYRGPLLIHAGKKLDRIATFADGTPVPAKLVHGAIVGSAELYDCVPLVQAPAGPFTRGPWCYLLRDAKPFLIPLPCAGQLGIWNAPTVYTSCFNRRKLIPPCFRPVGIAAWSPSFKGDRDRRLMPTPAMRKLPDLDAFQAAFDAHLATLDAQEVYRSLGDNAVLLCFEPPGFTCHRRLVAEWLENSLGVEVPELGFPRAVIPTFHDAPVKETPVIDLPWEVQCDHCRKKQAVALSHDDVLCVKCGQSFAVTW